MGKWVALLLAAAMAIAFAAPGWATSSLESGSVSYGQGISATGWWHNPETRLSWQITEEDGTYHYTYKWTTRSRSLGDLIIEVGPGAGLSDFWNFSALPDDDGPGIHSAGRFGLRNPGLREPIFGLEFDGSGTSMVLSFFSDLAPMWGDFYTKAGFFTHAYNSGLGQTPNGNGGFIAVPGAASPVPIPGAAILLGSGIAGLVAFRKRVKSGA